jgi:hypothetical protein
MFDFTIVRQFLATLPEVVEASHFDKIAFKAGKKIFVTFDEKLGTITIKLSVANQDVFSIAGKGIIYPVPNKWGQQGWTIVDLKQITPHLLQEALKTAYCDVAPKKLSALVKFDE